MLWEWNPILPGFGETSTPAQGPTLPARLLCEPQPISDQPMGGGVSTSRRAVLTRGITVFVPGLLEL